jgi:nitroreductase
MNDSEPASAELFPAAPVLGDALAATHSSPQTRAFVALRRSLSLKQMVGPGPEGATLDAILQVALRVPDHRRVGPWRLIVFEGQARAQFGDLLARIAKGNNPEMGEDEIEQERRRLLRAPVVVAVVSSPDKEHKTPVWEQELSAGALCLNLLNAASSAGFAGNWLTEWPAYDADVATHMGLGRHERIAGFIYLGKDETPPLERPRPDPADKILRWTPVL